MAFFDEEKPKEELENTPEKIKLGDQEFDQEELSQLVEKGRLAKEIEEKQNTDLSKVYPEYTKKSQQLKEMETEITELRKLKEEKENNLAAKQNAGEQLSPDEVRQLAAKHGYVTKENIQEYMDNYMAGQNLLKDIRSLEEKGNPYETDDLPKVDAKEHIDWMDKNGVMDPVKAYKLRFENEIDSWKEKSLQSNKRKGLHVEDASTPGNKTPTETKVNRQNLGDFVKASLRGEI